jgi:hypothetical protein
MKAGREKMSFLRCERRLAGQRSLILPLLLMMALNAAQAEQSARSSEPKRSSSDQDAVRDQLLSTEVESRSSPVLPAEIIVQKMMATSARRSTELQSVRATRTYRLQYHGFLGTRDAGMKVLATYTAPNKLDFSVISQTGSKLLLNRVLLKLLESEREAFKDQKQIELSPANYTFDSEGMETSDDDPCYVLGVSPRKENKFLYRGKVWIDAHDFALARMQGQPAKSPSFWIKDTQINSTWHEVGGFWLIQHNQSVSHVRLGGMATLTIDYTDYQITRVGRAHVRGQNPQLPDPSSVTPQR